MALVRQFYCDDETGEVTTYEVNNETGELFLGNCGPNFAEGRTLQRVSVNTVFPKTGYICQKKKYQSLKAKILSGSNTMSHRLLFLPTLIICPALFCSILSILEIYLHISCHKKNSKLDDPSVYYRSPFHIISSMFCAVCRDKNSASRVGEMQDKRRDRYDYIRGIVI